MPGYVIYLREPRFRSKYNGVGFCVACSPLQAMRRPQVEGQATESDFHAFFMSAPSPGSQMVKSTWKPSIMKPIGELVKEELAAQERTITWFARKLCIDRSNVYRLFQKNSIDTDLLMRISLVLKKDFFTILARSLEEKRNSQQQWSNTATLIPLSFTVLAVLL